MEFSLHLDFLGQSPSGSSFSERPCHHTVLHWPGLSPPFQCPRGVRVTLAAT